MPGYQVAASPNRQPLPELVHVNWISSEAAQRQLQGHVLPLTLMLWVMLLEPRNVICFICRLIRIPIYANTVHFSLSPLPWKTVIIYTMFNNDIGGKDFQ